MRFTAVFRGTDGPGGSLDPETRRLYMMFDVTSPVPTYNPDDERVNKAVASVCQRYLDELSGEPQLIEVLVGGFMPRSKYKDPLQQMKREGRAKRVKLYVYKRGGEDADRQRA